MTIKQMWNKLINKKWEFEDFLFLVLMIFLASIFTTPLFGIPIGLVVYFILFLSDYDDFDEAEKDIILNSKTRSRARIYTEKIYCALRRTLN